MSKLEDIGRNYAIVAPLIPPSDVQWLIQRVRQLETALRNIEDQCLHANAFANPPAVVLETAREAVKES